MTCFFFLLLSSSGKWTKKMREKKNSHHRITTKRKFKSLFFYSLFDLLTLENISRISSNISFYRLIFKMRSLFISNSENLIVLYKEVIWYLDEGEKTESIYGDNESCLYILWEFFFLIDKKSRILFFLLDMKQCS